MLRRILIGIADGSGSGKTLVARNLVRELGSDCVVIIDQDSYYKDLEAIPLRDREGRNFDHPDAFDYGLLRQHVRVRPMHLRFVACPHGYQAVHRSRPGCALHPAPAPRSGRARALGDVIIPGGGHNAVAIDLVKTKIQELLRERGGTGSPAGSAGRAPEPGRAPGGNAAWGSSESPAPGPEPCLADPGESS